MAQVRGIRPKVGGRLALFCIHRVNRVYGALVVTSWTCNGALRLINCRIIVIITARCTIVQSAVLGLHVVCLSVRLSETLVDQDHIV